MHPSRNLGRFRTALIVGAITVVAVAFKLRVGRSDGDCGQYGTIGAVVLTNQDLQHVILRSGLPPKFALRELLWQESERQRLGLPGGDHIFASRSRTVVAYVDRLRAGGGPIDLRNELPQGTSLTSCGARTIGLRD